MGSERSVNKTIAAGVTERSWGLRDHKEFGCSEAVSEGSREKNTNQNGMLIFGAQWNKGL